MSMHTMFRRLSTIEKMGHWPTSNGTGEPNTMSKHTVFRCISIEMIGNWSTINGTENTLHHLISEQEWDKVEYLLTCKSIKSHCMDRITVTILDDLILHYACQFNPPLRIIDMLSKKFPSSIDATDHKGRYPVHMAVAGGCEPEVIMFLIRENHTSAGAQDIVLRTPMHYAAISYAKNYRDIHTDVPTNEVNENILNVVKFLSQVSSQSANVEDGDGMNPIEYAVMNSMNIECIKTMQRASRMDWRSRNASMKDKAPFSSRHNCLGATAT